MRNLFLLNFISHWNQPSRIGRIRFVLHTSSYFLIYLIVANTVLWSLINLANQRPDWTLGHWPIAALIVVYILGVIPHQLPARRRLADCDLSPHWAYLLFLPLLNAPVLAILLFKPGTGVCNRFGAVPQPNSLRVYMSTLCSLALLTVVLLLMIYLLGQIF